MKELGRIIRETVKYYYQKISQKYHHYIIKYHHYIIWEYKRLDSERNKSNYWKLQLVDAVMEESSRLQLSKKANSERKEMTR